MMSIGGDNLQFYPNFALFSTLGGMKLDHDFYHVSKLSEDQRKRSSPKIEQFFLNLSELQKKVQTSSSALVQTIGQLLGEMQM